MSPEKQEALFNKYPDIFRERSWSPQETCMCWGLEMDGGWYDIIDSLCANLTLLKRYTGLEIVFRQTKQKLGTLRVYWRLDTFPVSATHEEQKIWWNIVEALVGEAERCSAQTCEITGEYGELCVSESGWYKTLCKEEAKKGGCITLDEYRKRREEAEKDKS